MRAIRHSKLLVFCAVASLQLTQFVSAEQATEVQATTQFSVSILDVMEKVITPATNTLWGADDPATDEEWLALEEAAITTLTAANLTAIGGTGGQDNEWAQATGYQAFNRAMQISAKAMLTAIQERDLDSMFNHGDSLYSACEGCHLQYNPGVINSQ